MSKLDCMLALRHEVASWSDSVLDDAVEFAKEHKAIFTGKNPPVGKSQLYGLANLARNTSNFQGVRKFINHQAQKAVQRAEASSRASAHIHEEVVDFWTTVGGTLSKFAETARSLSDKSGLTKLGKPNREARKDVDALHRTLAVEYLQHLIAEILLISKQQEQPEGQPHRANQSTRYRGNNTRSRR